MPSGGEELKAGLEVECDVCGVEPEPELAHCKCHSRWIPTMTVFAPRMMQSVGDLQGGIEEAERQLSYAVTRTGSRRGLSGRDGPTV